MALLFFYNENFVFVNTWKLDVIVSYDLKIFFFFVGECFLLNSLLLKHGHSNILKKFNSASNWNYMLHYESELGNKAVKAVKFKNK